MATIYLRNALFTDRFRQVNAFENSDDETLNIAVNEMGEHLRMNQLATGEQHPVRNDNQNDENMSNLIGRAERYLNRLNNVWYWNLFELRLNKVTVRSMTVLFNHCINLKVLDVVLFFNRASIVFENQVR